MDALLLSSEETYLLLARQGYAAQGRRQAARRLSIASSRRSVSTVVSETNSPTDVSFPGHDGYSVSAQSLSASGNRVEPIDLPTANTSPCAIYTDGSSPLYGTSPNTLTSASPCSPSGRGLHERFLTQLKDSIIEEEDGEDGVVIYNGLKRLSMSEAGLVMEGRPRIINF